jgi:hypothetical protein
MQLRSLVPGNLIIRCSFWSSRVRVNAVSDCMNVSGFYEVAWQAGRIGDESESS